MRGITIADPEQVVLESDPYRRLSYTLAHRSRRSWPTSLDLTDEARERIAAEPRSKVTFEIEPLGELVKLTVVHDGFEPGSVMLPMVSQGWPRVLSGLKTLLETGEALPADPEPPSGRLGLSPRRPRDGRARSVAARWPAATLGAGGASCWIVALRQMGGMDMGVETELGSFGFFLAAWVADDGGDDAARRGAGDRAAARAGGARRAARSSPPTSPSGRWSALAVYALVPARTAPPRPAAVTIAAGALRAHAAQARVPPALPRGCPLRARLRRLLRRLEHRPDGGARRARAHERRMDGRGRRPRARPEAPAAAGVRRRPLPLAIVALGVVVVAPSDPRAHPDDVKRRAGDDHAHTTGTREEWLAARLELLEAEKELTRRGDEVARRRQELPWVRIDKDYRFETDDGRGLAGRPLRGPLAAADVPLHVRAGLHRRLPGLLGDRRRLQRVRSSTSRTTTWR